MRWGDVPRATGTVIFPHRILFLRHGETSWNAESRLQGQHDIPLNPRGREQASAVGRTLRARFGAGLKALDAAGAFVTSPLSRARETMELARAAMGLDPQRYHCEPDLMELNFGAWEGLTWAEATARYPKAVRARFADRWNAAPPGGESYALLAARLKPWLAALAGDAFVVSHGGVARVLMALAGDAEAAAAETPIAQGRAFLFEADGWRYFE
jgi:broad specificity phosphatase PhoE